MGLCKEVFIDQKLFELKKENAKWWRIIESSHRGVKYISVDGETLGWLGSMVKDCTVTVGSQEFLQTRRKGDTVIIVRKGHNFNGSFISISEFGRDKRRGLLVIPEGRKGEGWKKLADILMEMADFQIVAAKKNNGEGGVPSSLAGGARTYSEVLKKLPYQDAVVVSGVTIPEDVQRNGVAESSLAGLNEGSILKMLTGLEEKIGIVLDEINHLKRCVKGKEVMGRIGGPGMGLSRTMGLGKGQTSGPVKVWRAVEKAGSGKGLGSVISDQGKRVPPITSLPATMPAQKWPTTSVDPSGEMGNEIRLGSEISDQSQDASVEPINGLSATLPAQKLPTHSDDYSGEAAKEVRREETEEGEFLALESASASLSSELLLGNVFSEFCVVDEAPEEGHEQSGLRDRELHRCGEMLSRDSNVIQSGLPLLVRSSSDELVDGVDSLINNMGVNGETNKLMVSVIPKNSIGEEGTLTPLCTLPPSDYRSYSTHWIFKKVEELQKIFGVSFGGYEEQFMALLVAIEASRSKSASKQDRELKRLTCSINYDVKEGSSGRVRSKGRGKLSFNEA
ncbi:uncharacterized protein LOC118347632 [Juglans regia]|uniref:Uncharacterized protein LOC118347632 n=1 Tax=Juglans regia TaxID=51240 RepID=A0A6P9E783_JUGRE|nr:uncharacterized protein LOC118347632 [Juglans regia]